MVTQEKDKAEKRKERRKLRRAVWPVEVLAVRPHKRNLKRVVKPHDHDIFIIVDEKTGRKLFRMDVESREDYDDSYCIYDFKTKRNVFGTTCREDVMGLLNHLTAGGTVEGSGYRSWRNGGD